MVFIDIKKISYENKIKMIRCDFSQRISFL